MEREGGSEGREGEKDRKRVREREEAENKGNVAIFSLCEHCRPTKS